MKRSRASSDGDRYPPNKKSRTSTPLDTKKWDEWVSASSTRNYLLNDPILDWLSYHYSTLATQKPNYTTKITKAVSGSGKHRPSSEPSPLNANTFTDFILAQGRVFETKVMEYLYKRFGSEAIVDIGGNDDARSDEKVEATLREMIKGTPMIYSGVLHNPENKTYGIPDLLVRSDWINHLITISVISDKDIAMPSTFSSRKCKYPYHYRVIDIKYSTLHLCADGLHLLNSGSLPAYKGQLWIYNEALARIQGYRPSQAYVLGKRWDFTFRSQTYRGTSCVDRLGVIDFDAKDAWVVPKTKEAIEWIRDMRKDGATWDMTTIPLARKELYPNMCNHYDHPWRSVKETIAKEIKEITDLWMCGVKNRENSHAHGVYRWDDPECTPDILGIKGETVRGTLEKILYINRKEGDEIIDPKVIEDTCVWRDRANVEFYVDFEFINDVMCDLNDSQFPVLESHSFIFMIGVGYYDSNHTWTYLDFTINALKRKEEMRICKEFSEYVRNVSHDYGVANPLLIHWSNAEVHQWKEVTERLDRSDNDDDHEELLVVGDRASTSEPRWFDLLEVFKKEPVVIRGCLGFGLKEVAGALKSHGLIESSWDTSDGVTDGLAAMLAAYKASKDAKRMRTVMSKLPQMKNIVKYNEVDCKVLGEIIEFLREKMV